jgi:hypothetical protein
MRESVQGGRHLRHDGIIPGKLPQPHAPPVLLEHPVDPMRESCKDYIILTMSGCVSWAAIATAI